MTNKDQHIKLIEAINDIIENLELSDEAIMVMFNSECNTMCLPAFAGNWEILSNMMSNDQYLNFRTSDDKKEYENMKKAILNIAINIASRDSDILMTLKKSVDMMLGGSHFSNSEIIA